MPIARTRANADTNFFACITTSPQFRILVLWNVIFVAAQGGEALFVRPDASGICLCADQRFVVSAAIASCEHGAVLISGPAANGGARWLAAFGRELAQINSVAERSVAVEYCFHACIGLRVAVANGH